MHIIRTIPLLALLLAGAALLAGGPAPSSAQPGAPRVLLLGGGDQSADQAVAQALQSGGLTVTSGPEAPAFDGTQANLASFDVLVILAQQNVDTPASPAGLAAIEGFVRGGGSLLVGAWYAERGPLPSLMPATDCGTVSAATAQYQLAAPHPLISASLPASLSFSPANFAGSEACLAPRAAATVFYRSTTANGAGLAAWNVGDGQVAAFSSHLSAIELTSAGYRQLLRNTVEWLAATSDATPPTVTGLTIGGSGQLVGGREVPVTLAASDAGGSGVAAYSIVEYVFSNDLDAAWTEVAQSGWLRYRQPGASLTWRLSDDPGIHYLQVWAADTAGNISREPGLGFVNYTGAGSTPVAADAFVIYRLSPPAGSELTVRLQAVSGNPDLYVFGPGVSFAPEDDLPTSQVSFVSQVSPAAPFYQIEVSGFSEASFLLSVLPGLAAIDDPPPSLERRGRGSILSFTPNEPAPDGGRLPPPPLDGEPAGLLNPVYLPLLQR